MAPAIRATGRAKRARPGGKGGVVPAILSIVLIVVRVIAKARYRNTVMRRYFKKGYR